MNFTMEKVVDGCDSTDHFITSTRKEQLHARMLMKWMLFRIDQLTNVALERRYPVLIVAIKPEREVDESFCVRLRANRLYAYRIRLTSQIRSISRPTVLKASST